MGLGLSICHRIIESHGGRIDVESVLDRFTEFSITLPGLADEEESIDLYPDPNRKEEATTAS